jgi:hypothetical protein
MPVAANHGAARIMNINVMRPSLFGVESRPTTVPLACRHSMLPLKILGACGPLSTALSLPKEESKLRG